MSSEHTTLDDPRAERLVEESRARRARALLGRERVSRWSAAALFLVVAAALSLGVETERPASFTLLVGLVVLYAFASRIDFEIGSGSAVPTQLVFVPLLFELPAATIPLAVAAGLVGGHLPDLVRGRMHPERIPGLVGSAWYSVAPALVILAAGEPELGASALPWLVLAVLAQFAGDFVLTGLREWTAVGVPLTALVGAFVWIFAVDALLTPVGLAFALAAEEWAPAVTFVLPLLVLVSTFARERRLRIDQTLELSNAYRGTVFLLGDVVEADDQNTGTHSRGVVALVLSVADRLGLDARERRRAEFTALLHDVGKLRIPKEIINKPGPLTPDERAIIETHTIEGQQLLERVGGLLAEVGSIVRSCHEWWDGSGYPDGLAGEQIPVIARIVCCCDAFDAMISERPYRPSRSIDEAIEELRRNAGTQFDPTVVQALEAVVASTWQAAA